VPARRPAAVRFALWRVLFLRAVRAAFFTGLERCDPAVRGRAARLDEVFRGRRPAAARFGFTLRLALLRLAGRAFGFAAARDGADWLARLAGGLAGVDDVGLPAATLAGCDRDRSPADRASDFAGRTAGDADGGGAAADGLPRAVRAGFATRYGARTETRRAKIVSMSPTPSTSTILFLRW